jgi:O-antigen ligase
MATDDAPGRPIIGRAAVIRTGFRLDLVREQVIHRWEQWVPVCLLALIVASDYKVRVRSVDDTVGGQADPFVILEIGIYLAVGAFCVLRYGRPPHPRRVSLLVFLLYAYVIVMSVAALYSPYTLLALVRATQFVVVLVLTRCIAKHSSRRELHNFAHAFVVMVAGSVIFGVVVPFSHAQEEEGRFSWLYIHPVTAGIFLGIATMVVAGYLLSHRGEREGPRWPLSVYLILLALVGGGLIATQTRGAVLGALAGLAVLGWTFWRGRRKMEITLITGLFTGLIAVVATPTIVAFFARGEPVSQLETLNSRTDLWAQAWEFFVQKPLYGWGLTATRGLFLESIGLGGGHNAFVNVLVDGGLVATATWVGVLVTLVVTLYRIRRIPASIAPDRAILLGLIAFLVVDGMFVESLGAAANVASTWLFVAVAWTELLRADSERVAPAAEPNIPSKVVPVTPRPLPVRPK